MGYLQGSGISLFLPSHYHNASIPLPRYSIKNGTPTSPHLTLLPPPHPAPCLTSSFFFCSSCHGAGVAGVYVGTGRWQAKVANPVGDKR